jgi:polysaccharide biosynthesis protein PslG
MRSTKMAVALSLIMLLLMSMRVFAQEATPETTPEPTLSQPVVTSTYVVQRGDTLFRIAQRLGTTVDTLIALNNITNRDVIVVGQTLVVPSADATSEATPVPTAIVTPESTPAPATVTRAPTVDIAFGKGIEVFLAGQDIATLVEQVQSLDVEWVKLTLNWRDVELVQGTLNLDVYTEAVTAFSNANIKIMLTLTGAPDWARPSATEFALPRFGPPDNPADFGVFAGQIAERYVGRVQAYEIWLEPNLRRTWVASSTTSREDAKLSDVSYVELLKGAYTAIKAVDASALVISAGLAPTGLNDGVNAYSDQVFLTDMLQKGALDYVDAIGVEPDGFGNPPDAVCCDASDGVESHYESSQFYFLETLRAYRQILDKNGGSDKPLWVTRFGWGTAEGNTLLAPDDVFTKYLTYTDSAEQATYTQQAFELGEETGYVGAMFLFNLNGCAVNNGEACFYSLFASDGSVRPVGQALGLP